MDIHDISTIQGDVKYSIKIRGTEVTSQKGMISYHTASNEIIDNYIPCVLQNKNDYQENHMYDTINNIGRTHQAKILSTDTIIFLVTNNTQFVDEHNIHINHETLTKHKITFIPTFELKINSDGDMNIYLLGAIIISIEDIREQETLSHLQTPENIERFRSELEIIKNRKIIKANGYPFITGEKIKFLHKQEANKIKENTSKDDDNSGFGIIDGIVIISLLVLCGSLVYSK